MKKISLIITFLFFIVGCKKKVETDFVSQKENKKLIEHTNENTLHETQFKTVEIPKGDLSSEQIINFVGLLEGYIYKPNESNIDAEDLAEKLSDKIVGSINSQKSYNLDKILKLNSKLKKENIKVYSFGHDSGGTRGFITYPIIVWKGKNNKQYSFNLSKDINCRFEKIYKLTNNLFLLIGYESGSGAGYQSIVYVIEIKNDKLNNEYCAFVKRPYLNFESGNYTFNDKKKILEFKLDNEHRTDNLDEVFYYSDRYGKYKTDTISAKKLKLMIEDEYYENHSFKLKFNGKEFEAVN